MKTSLQIRCALARAKAEGINKFPAYATAQQAEARYQQMHGFMEQDTKQYLSTRGTQPSADDYVNAVKGTPTWINNPKADGLYLLDHGARLVRTPNGSPIEVKFSNAGDVAASHHIAARATAEQTKVAGGGFPVELGVSPAARAWAERTHGLSP